MPTTPPGSSVAGRDAMAGVKVVLGKVSMDGHDRGVRVLARLLRDAGMEVVYLGKYLPHEAVIEAAIQENAQVVGLSFLSGEHLAHTRRFAAALRATGLDDVLFLVGGVIPRQDVQPLLAAGADGVFLSGTPLDTIVSFIQDRVGEKEARP